MMTDASPLTVCRGTKGSYQQWADKVDDQSFTFENLLPYFQKSINFTAPDYSKLPLGDNVSYDATAFSPTGGPLQLSYSNYRQPITPSVEESMTSLGVKSIPGLNSGNLIGYSRYTSTIDSVDETRSSSETSFLRNAIATSFLQVYHNTAARRILFDGNKTATGVEVATADDLYILSARKEVIVAAGVVSLVQKFMLSIGPAYRTSVQISSDSDGLRHRSSSDPPIAWDPCSLESSRSGPESLGKIP